VLTETNETGREKNFNEGRGNSSATEKVKKKERAWGIVEIKSGGDGGVNNPVESPQAPMAMKNGGNRPLGTLGGGGKKREKTKSGLRARTESSQKRENRPTRPIKKKKKTRKKRGNGWGGKPGGGLRMKSPRTT